MSIYEELKAKGILVYRASGSPTALALKDRLKQDGFGAPSMSTGPFLMQPTPGTILTYYPLYTDDLAAVADWYKENWKEKRKPKVAYLTADNAMGKSIEIPQMKAYLKKIGYDFAGIQYVPLVPTSPPTTQLMWLKQNNVDLALGVMVNPGIPAHGKGDGQAGHGPLPGLQAHLRLRHADPPPCFCRCYGHPGRRLCRCAAAFPPGMSRAPG